MNAVLWLLVVLAALPASSWDLPGSQADSGLQQAPLIPEPLQHAAPFVEHLRSAGLTVRDVQQSHLTGMFKGTPQAAYVSTNLGVVEVVVFAGAADAERISITYSKDPRAPSRHRYSFQGLPTHGNAQTLDAAHPAYFTLHRNWFIVTYQVELEAFLKRSLGQTSR